VDSQDSLNSDIEVLHGTDQNSLNKDVEGLNGINTMACTKI